MITRWRIGQWCSQFSNGKVSASPDRSFLNNRRNLLMLLVVGRIFIAIGFLLPAYAEHSIIKGDQNNGCVSYCCLTVMISCLLLVNDME